MLIKRNNLTIENNKAGEKPCKYGDELLWGIYLVR